MSRLRAWLELMRLSNLPTVWSNTLVGLVLGYTASVMTFGLPEASPPEWRLLVTMLAEGWTVLLAASLLYVGGMILNDVADVRFDRAARPERPIPSGRVSLNAARGAAVAMLAGGVLIFVGYGIDPMMWALVLVGLIAAYNVLHKRVAGAVLLMGGCRAVLYFLPASLYPAAPTIYWRAIVPFALILGLYVVLLTLIARRETGDGPGRRRWLAWVMIPLALAGVLSIMPLGGYWLWAGVAAVALAGWLGWAAWLVNRPTPDVGRAVHAWLAGICLLDAYFLTLMARPLFALVAGAWFVLTLMAHRRIMGT